MKGVDPIAEALWEVRQRWAALWLGAAALVYLLALFFPGLGPWELAGRATMAAVCLCAWWWTRSAPGRGRWLTGLVLALSMVHAVAQALSTSQGKAPIQLLVVLPIALAATLLGGARLGIALSLLPCAALGVALAFGPPVPYLPLHAVNLCLYLVAGQLFVVALVRRLREGAVELAGSVSVLRRAHEGATALHDALSERVSRAAARLEEGVLGNEPAQLELAEALARELARARTLLPPELPLHAVSLGQRLAALQVRLRSVGLWTATLAVVGSAVYVAWRGPRSLLVLNLPFAVLTCGLSLLHLRRPRWGTAAVSTFLVVACPFIARRNWEWFTLSPQVPPNAAAWTLTAVIATGVVGLPLGLGVLAVGTLSLAFGIAAHPGLPALLPLAIALAAGTTCWTLDRLPRDLLTLLQRWQQEASEGIRRRRRLAATFFHDLANPLQVVQVLLSAERSAEDEVRLRAMTRRIRLVVETALGGPDAPRALEAGVLCAELEQLFRERLAHKGQRLRVGGALTARPWACEPLLRESVLGNLVSNSIKFSPPGADIDLSVREEPGAVIFSIEDRGPGLPPDVRAAVAARTEAASRPGTAGEPGSGFGLMLACDYLESMGGALELGDREGGGAKVQVRLPSAQTDAGAASAAPGPPRPS